MPVLFIWREMEKKSGKKMEKGKKKERMEKKKPQDKTKFRHH